MTGTRAADPADPVVEWVVGTALAAAAPGREGRGAGAARSPERWDGALALAERHGVAPLLWAGLDADGRSPTVPPVVADGLRQAYYRTAALSARLAHEVEVVGAALDHAGIPWLALKGVSLAERLYGNLALRPCEDLDLLVREPDVHRAVRVLGACGYSLRRPRGYAAYRTWHFAVTLDRSAASPICLELHWALADRFSLQTPDGAGVWERARDHHLAPADEILHLATHLDKHGYLNGAVRADDDPAWVRRLVCHPASENRLIWFADLWRFLLRSREAPPLGEVAARAQAWRAEAALRRSLLVLDGLSDHGLPASYRPLIESPAPSARRSRFLYRLVMGGPPPALSPPGATKPWFLVTGDRTQARPVRALDLIRYLAPPPTFLRRHYPRLGRMWPLAAALRPLFLAAEHGREALGLLLRRARR